MFQTTADPLRGKRGPYGYARIILDHMFIYKVWPRPAQASN